MKFRRRDTGKLLSNRVPSSKLITYGSRLYVGPNGLNKIEAEFVLEKGEAASMYISIAGDPLSANRFIL